MTISAGWMAEAVGWSLLHFCWQAPVLALVYWLADLSLPKPRAQARYLASLGTMLAMLAAFSMTLAYEIGQNEPPAHSARFAASNSVSSPALTMLSDLRSAENDPTGALAPARLPLGNFRLGRGIRPAAPAQNEARSLFHLLGTELPSALTWIDVGWLLGVVCLSARSIGGWWWLQRLRVRSLAEAPAIVSASFARVRACLGVRRAELRISAEIPGPMAIGVLRSLVLLPASALFALSPEQIEAVLAHELAHVRRADYFWNLVQTAVETLFFFHPAVWWVSKRAREQRELCCDDVAIGFCTDALLYASALLSLEERRRDRISLAMALDGHGSWSGLRRRIARMLGEPQESGRGKTAPPLGAFCGVFLAAAAILLVSATQLFGGLLQATTARSQTHVMVQASTTTPQADPAPAPGGNSNPNPTAKPVAQPSPRKPQPDSPRPPAKPQPAPLPLQLGVNDRSLVTVRPLLPLQGMRLPDVAVLAQLHPAPNVSIDTGELQANIGNQIATALNQGDLGRNLAQAAGQNALSTPDPEYIRQMRAAGYDLSPEKYLNLKILGVTPAYALAMQKVGLGKPSVGNLMAMKALGVTPEYLDQLRSAKIELHSFGEAIEFKAIHVSPGDASELESLGFGPLDAHQIVLLHTQNITPAYAAAMRKQFPNLTIGDLIQLKIFRIDDAFIAEAKRHNFEPLTVDKLVKLRISGLL